MSRTRGTNPDPKNPRREIGIYNQSLTYKAFSAGRGGSTPNVTSSRDYVFEADYQTGNLSLYAVDIGGGRGAPVAVRTPNGRWEMTGVISNKSEQSALQQSLNRGNFGKTLNNELQIVATRDLGSDQFNRRFRPVTAKNPETGSPAGGTNPPSSGQTPSGTQEQGSTPSITPDDSKRIYNIISNGQEARTKYDGDLKYPEKYEGNDYLTIEMIRYVPNKNLSLGRVGSDQESGELFDTKLGLPGISERSSSEKSIARFTLPIPANLIDANPVNWSSDELNPLQAYGAGAIGRILGSNNFASGIGNELKRGSETLRANSDAAKAVLNNELIRKILGGVNTLTRSTGAIVNPNVELLFKGPSLRTFTFSFKMTPRSQKESEIIKKIIRRLKQGMSIKRASNGIFLASPNVFKLKFWYVPPVSENDSVTGGTPREHPYLPKFKVCALQNMSVNYMPDGSYMTYGDGSMIGYDMTLTFSEIDPIFDDDYTKLDSDKDESIGY